MAAANNNEEFNSFNQFNQFNQSVQSINSINQFNQSIQSINFNLFNCNLTFYHKTNTKEVVILSANIKKYVSLTLLVMFAISTAAPAAFGGTANQTYYGDLGSNYYSFYGSPDIYVSLQGSGEYARGQTATIPLTLTNKGVIEGFKTENEVKAGGSVVSQQLNSTLQQMEVQNINSILAAIGIVATLESDIPGITVKTGPQEAGSLPSGASTFMPLRYSVDIPKDLPAGEYELTLNVTYKHLRNVIYSADAVEVTGPGGQPILAGIRNLNASYWYNENVTQQIPITIKVKEATKFEIVGIQGNLSTKKNNEIQVTYRNSGEEEAKMATVRLSTATPFSTTDDQSYLGTVAPGEEAVAHFKISVDKDAVLYDKLYALNSEILYEDNYGHQQISDVQKIELKVEKEPFWNVTTIAVVIVLMIVIVVGGYYVVMSQKYKKEGLDKKPFDSLFGKQK